MQNIIILLGLAVLGGFLLFGAFNSSAGFNNLVIEEIRFRENTTGPDIDEWIAVANRTGQQVDVTGWRIDSATGGDVSSTSVGQTYNFPSGCIVPAGGKLYIHSGPIVGASTSTACNQKRIDLYPKFRNTQGAADGWWEGVAEIENTVWNNQGDTATLLKFTGGSGLFVYDRVDTCTYVGNEANGVKKCR